MLAPIIREMPAAIEKNAVTEGMSRMVRKEVKSTLQHQPDPASLRVVFRNNTLAGSQKERRPYERLSCFAYDAVNFQLRK
jgi:hypothetical protein